MIVSDKEVVNPVKEGEDPKGLVCQVCGLVRDNQIKLDKHMEYHNDDEEDTDRSETDEQSTPATADEVALQEEEILIKDLITLSVGKSSGQARQTPQSQPIPKSIQHHCSLSNQTSGILCSFQSNTKSMLDMHIKKVHQGTHPCIGQGCHLQFYSIDELAKHVTSDHKNTSSTYDAYKCSQCGMSLSSNGELNNHIIESHKNYKPCKNYAVNRCEYNEDCRFYHIILPPGQHICYKCATQTKTKSDMMKHIKDVHGGTVCHKFLLNKCDFTRCLFSHIVPSVPGVAKVPEELPARQFEVPSAPREEDFPNLPTMGPVVRAEGRAEERDQAKSPVQQVHQFPGLINFQDMTKVIEHMLPQIMEKVLSILASKKMQNPQ